MKKKIWFRFFILALSLSAAAALATAQPKKSAPVKSAAPKPAVWQSVDWEIWGVAFSLPPQLKFASETPENNESRPDGYFGATRIYEKNPPVAAVANLELMISITNWKGEKFKIDEENRKLELTPEQMLEIDHSADQRNMLQADSPIEAVEYFEAGGLKGTYVLANEKFGKAKVKSPATRIRVLWQTFRIYQGNIQRISLALSGQRKELETMKKVIQSLKFA